jgi:hypothetical protein
MNAMPCRDFIHATRPFFPINIDSSPMLDLPLTAKPERVLHGRFTKAPGADPVCEYINSAH